MANIVPALLGFATFTEQLHTSLSKYEANKAEALDRGELRSKNGVKKWVISSGLRPLAIKESKNMTDLNAKVYETIDIIYTLTDK